MDHSLRPATPPGLSVGDRAGHRVVLTAIRTASRPRRSGWPGATKHRRGGVPVRSAEALGELSAEGGDAGCGHFFVLVHRAPAHPYRADHLAVALQRDAAGEDDDPAA